MPRRRCDTEETLTLTLGTESCQGMDAGISVYSVSPHRLMSEQGIQWIQWENLQVDGQHVSWPPIRKFSCVTMNLPPQSYTADQEAIKAALLVFLLQRLSRLRLQRVQTAFSTVG